MWLDAAFTSARPPAAGPRTQTSNYGILGTRADAQVRNWKLNGAGLLGRSVQESGNWLWLEAEAEYAGARAGVFFFDYNEELDYQTYGVQLKRDFKLLDDVLVARPTLFAAGWHADEMSGQYAVGGTSVVYSRMLGSSEVLLQLTGDMTVAGDNGFADGVYYTTRADAYSTIKGVTLGAGLVQTFHPRGDETGYSLWASHTFGEQLRVDAQFARSVADPFYGSPRSDGFTIIASWRAKHRPPPPPPVVAEVGAPSRSGRLVKFTLEYDKANSVAVSGTFSDWRPLPLKRAGKVWTGSFVIEPGTHQFGFLINGATWYVPPDAADVVDDGFGRKNVTLVVRPR